MNNLRSFERWDRGFEPHSRHGCLCVRLFCVFVILCVGTGLASGLSIAQRVLLCVYKKDYETEEEVTAQRRAVVPLMNECIIFIY
jgi:hypothetical protein